MILSLLLSLGAPLFFDASARATDPIQDMPATIGARLMQEVAVKAAVERVRRDEAQLLEEQLRLCEIPAPPFKEARRAEAFAKPSSRLV